jgi:hypothetical protein
MMQGMGDLTQITVYNFRSEEEQSPLTDSVIEQIGAMEHVKVATPIFQSDYINSVTILGGKNGRYQINGWIGQGNDVVGMNPEAIKEYGYELIEGRYAEEKDKPFTVIAGQNVDYQFYNPKRKWPHNRVEPTPDENGVMPTPFIDVYKDKITLTLNPMEEGGKVIEKDIKVVGKVKEDFNKGYETYGGFIMNIDDLIALEEEYIRAGKTVCCYTTRALITADTGNREDDLRLSVMISDAVQSLVGRLSVTPAFVIAKGGITSSDIGTKALGVRKAYVLGQIRPGIPVWRTGSESTFPGTPYVIFPGNVGEAETLKEAAEILV